MIESLNSSIEVTIENLKHVEEYWSEESLILFFASEFRILRKSANKLKLIFLGIQNEVSPKIQAPPLLSRSQSEAFYL